ncbi:MAG: flavodoxin [Chloroflexota bacterium]|nr:flavodoxin [Chloroflexota bacterium]
MKVLIIYDATCSSIKRIAQAIAGTLRAEGSVFLSPVEETSRFNLKTVDLLIVGCPTERLDLTPAMQAYLESIPAESLNGLLIAAFDTRPCISVWETGSAAWSIVRHLEELGATHISPPESFFVCEGSLEEGELERAAQWATALLNRAEADLRVAENA